MADNRKYNDHIIFFQKPNPFITDGLVPFHLSPFILGSGLSLARSSFWKTRISRRQRLFVQSSVKGRVVKTTTVVATKMPEGRSMGWSWSNYRKLRRTEKFQYLFVGGTLQKGWFKNLIVFPHRCTRTQVQLRKPNFLIHLSTVALIVTKQNRAIDWIWRKIFSGYKTYIFESAILLWVLTKLI